ncbi:Uncharacterized conserved protein, contains a C-terminal beta-barrel porin domain [Sphingobium faniae]|nr:Uncharacterized conserved protein, contains a C-terminal beta-barrel porin domain [Sphingobium faniae]
MTVKASKTCGVRAGLALGASLLAVSATQPAVAQFACADGSAGPVCVIDNTSSTGPVAGTVGTATIVTNSGTIAGTPAIGQGSSFLLNVTNATGGVIDGNGGAAITGAPSLGFLITNAGTINGDVVFNDQPAPNIFSAPLVSYISDGGVLNGDLRLGTSGFGTAYFLQRGADDGIMGSLSAGAGLDIYAKGYDQTQSVALGQYAKPADFEIEGYEIRGSDKTLTLTGGGTTINLAGDGNVVNEAQIDLVSIAGAFPPGVDVVPAAISYYQPQVATFRREQIPLGQPGSFYTQTFGGALTSFTNNDDVNGDIRLATARFVNTATINLKTHSFGSVIHTAPDSDFLFRNSGTIAMADNGARIFNPEAEFEDSVDAAIRIRSALNTTGTRDARIENSGDIAGGLDARLAVTAFSFENSGTIAGLETANHFSRGLSINVGELDLVAGEGARDEYNAQSAAVLNTATGAIDHGAAMVLNANTATVENRGQITASGQEGGIALYVEHGLLSDDEDEVPGVAEAAAASLSIVNSGAIEGSVEIDGETSYISIVNSGDITRGPTAIGPSNYAEAFFGGSSAFELFNETDGDHVVELTNSGSIISSERGGSGLAIEVEAGDDDPLLIGAASVRVINSGTIAATGGATLTPAAVAPFLPADSLLVNPIAALYVDATDVTGASTVTIENRLGGVISASGNFGVVTPGGYLDQGASSNAASTVAVAASGKVINIVNAGRIEGGAGSDYAANPNVIFDEVFLPDRYLAGAIHTSGDEPDLSNGEVYVGSIDHVVNQSSGVIVGSIDLGANDDIIENYGAITGDVFLRDGNDTFIHSLLASFDGIADGGAGQDTLVFDITGAIYTGSIDSALRARFINFEIEELTGTGTIVTEERVDIAENGNLTPAEGSNIDVGAGNVAVQGTEAGSETLTVTPAITITGNVDMRGGNNTVNNEGVLNGSLSFGNGSNTVDNSGTITQGVSFGDGGNRFVNSGTVEGGMEFGAGDDELVLIGDWAVSGGVNGGAGIDVVQASFAPPPANEADVPVLDLSGFQDIEQFNVNGGTGKVGGTATFDQIAINDGRLIGAVGSTINADVDVASGGTFGSAGIVNGNINVASGGTLSPGASPEVMTQNGNLSLASGSVTLFEFVPAPGQSDQIIINNGGLQIADGAILNITGNRPLTPGVAYDMIVAEQGIDGEFTIGSWDRTAVQGFLRYTANRLQLLGTFVAPAGVNSQVGATVDYVNGLLVSGEASSALLAAVPSLLDGNGLASATAFGQINAEAYASAAQLGVEQGLSLASAARSSATKSGSAEARLFSYAQGLGDWRTLKADGGTGVARAKNRSSGLLGGLGYGSEAASVSAFVGYMDSRQRIEALGARTDADGMFVGVTGQAIVGGFTLGGTIAYDWSDATTHRTAPGNVDVTADYNLNSIVFDASANYDLALGSGWMLSPAIGFTHVSTKRDRATETGSSAFALDVESRRTKASFVDGAVAIRGSDDATVQPWAQLGLRHQLSGKAVAATASFIGASSGFTVLGAARKATVATAGAGIAAQVAPNLRIHAAYMGEFGGGSGSNVSAGLRFEF